MTGVAVFPGRAHGSVRAPSSKSHTHRAVISAASLRLRIRIDRPLASDDTLATCRAVTSLGGSVRREGDHWFVRPARPAVREERPIRIDCRGSGSTLRFATALAARLPNPVRFDGDLSLRRRPVVELLDALERLGATVVPTGREGGLPFIIRGPIHAGQIRVNAARSSQPLSAVLMSLAGLPTRSRVRVTGPLVSGPYVDLTVRLLRNLGAGARADGSEYSVGGPAAHPAPRRIRIPPDPSSAAYWWAAAAATGGDARVLGDFRDPQPDLALLDWLASAGVSVERSSRSVRVAGRPVRPFDVEVTGCPDLAPLISVLAATVPGRSFVRGGTQLIHKESDRRKETVRLVRAIGARCESRRGGMAIDGTAHPRPLRRRDLIDHRMIMSATVAALRGSGPSELGPVEAVRKSYPEFWNDLRRLGIRVESVAP